MRFSVKHRPLQETLEKFTSSSMVKEVKQL